MAEGQSIFSGISQEEAEEYRKLYEERGLQALNAYLKGKRDQWKTIPLNIGIIGNSGTGKSSLINAIRGLTGDDKGAARVGVTETTTKPTPYAHPNNEQLKFWDLPGVGTSNFPKEEYLEKILFDKFDFFLIITSIRFTENDTWLAKEIVKKEKQFFFVRTKIDGDIRNDKFDHPRTHNKEAALARIQGDIRKNLGTLYDDRKVFLIDNHRREMYDFNKLEERIIEDFPLLKREALILSLSTLSESMVRKKAQILRRYLWGSCLASGLIGLSPIPGTSILVDSAIILAQNELYFHQLGLDEESLNRTAKITSCDVAILQSLVDPIRSLLIWKGVVGFVKSIPIFTLKTAEEWTRFIPILGSVVGGVTSLGVTYTILDKILKKMEEAAVKVVQVAVKSEFQEKSKL